MGILIRDQRNGVACGWNVLSNSPRASKAWDWLFAAPQGRWKLILELKLLAWYRFVEILFEEGFLFLFVCGFARVGPFVVFGWFRSGSIEVV